MKFIKNYIKITFTKYTYVVPHNNNQFLVVLARLFTEQGDVAWIKRNLLDLNSNGISAEFCALKILNDIVLIVPALLDESGPEDYRIQIKRVDLLKLVIEWELLMQQKPSEIYFIYTKNEYAIVDRLPENVDVQNHSAQSPIGFAQKYIELTKNDNATYTTHVNGNFFLNVLAKLLNDNNGNTNWFKELLYNQSSEAIVRDGTTTRLIVTNDTVTLENLIALKEHFDDYPTQINRLELLRITNEWDALIEKGVERIFIIFKDNKYSVVDSLPSHITYHLKKCRCDLCSA
jgi:hypothetical protein